MTSNVHLYLGFSGPFPLHGYNIQPKNNTLMIYGDAPLANAPDFDVSDPAIYL